MPRINDDCGLSEFLAISQHNYSDNVPRTVQWKDVNRRVVYAAIAVGIGREDISKFCEILKKYIWLFPSARILGTVMS